MIVTAPRSVAWVAALGLSCWLLQLGCSPRRAERPDSVPPRTIAGDAAAVDAGRDGGRAQDASGGELACRVRRAARTFVGFSEGMSLEDFELAAFEAERIVAASRQRLCALDDVLDADGAIREALRGGAIEITSIVFTSDDASAADVQTRWVPDDDARAMPASAASLGWLLRFMRTDATWWIVAVRPA